MTSIARILADAVAALAAAGVPSPRADAELLIGHVLGRSRGEVQALAFADRELGDADAARLAELVGRRAEREPLQHLTGLAHFRGLELAVGPGVFVPRPETELVAQFAIDALATVASERPVAVDLGTGSGAIALALATEVPHSEVWAVEVSPDALAWARRNVERIGAANLRLVPGDIATALPELDGLVDVLVSNPPYIPEGMIPRDPEVERFDPPLALYGGADGLDAVRDLAATGRRLLRPGGALVVEHAEIQGEAIRSLLAGGGWRAVQTHPDLTGRPRATTATR